MYDPDQVPPPDLSDASEWEATGAHWRDARPHRLWRAHSDAVNRRLLDGWLPPQPVPRLLKTDLFDEAVSEGLLTPLRTRARTLVGIDIASTVASGASRRNPALHAVRADVRRLPFVDGAFDIVVSNSTLDHFAAVGDIVTSLRELARVLCPGGHLVLTLDNALNPMVALRNALPQRALRAIGLIPYAVGKTCGPRRLRRLVSDAGFEVARVSAVMHCWRVAAVWAADLLESSGPPRTRDAYLRLLLRFERLANSPLRFLTGHFIAIDAVKSESSPR